MAAAGAHSLVSIHWFRKGLRLHDNPALLRACEGARAVIPIFILDPWFAGPARVGANRYRFLLESLQDLDTSLRRHDSRLLVLRGKADVLLPELFARWGVHRLTYEFDSEPFALARDAAVNAAAKKAGVAVETFASHTLWDPRDVAKKVKGRPPVVYQSFLKLAQSLGAPSRDRPAPATGALPPLDLASLALRDDERIDVPTLAEMGYEGEGDRPRAPARHFPGGESEALRRLEGVLRRRDYVASFEKPNTSPNTLEPSTTVLSPYLKFGCLSPRRFYHGLHDVYRSVPRHSAPPVSLEGQLLWREFFYANSFTIPNFDRMVGNPVCKQIPWDSNPALLHAWENARTGYPWIDACMTQLREEGWLHHLARHAVACFLTRGDLWQSWEAGAKVFDRLLLDSDWALNNGNWMWLSASAYFAQYFRVYSPVAFPKKTDPEGLFVKRWIPALRLYPAEYIYEPWKAPKHLQRFWGCVVGEHYPERVVIHEEVLPRNLERMKAAYNAARDGAVVTIADGVSGVGATQNHCNP